MQQLNRNNYHTQLRPTKVIQFGGGNFLRAFCDNFIQIANDELNFNGNITVIQYVSPSLGTIINNQQGLYHLVLQGIKNGETIRDIYIIDSITQAVNPNLEHDKFLALAQEPDVRYILSNTTEAGIIFDATDDSVDKPANSFPAKLTQLLYARYQYTNGNEDKGFIILPCELIEDNGSVLKEICIKYAQLWSLSAAFVEWLNNANYFTSTLVDRIVSGYPKDDTKLISELQYQDELTVVGEPYASWIISGAEKIASELIFNNQRFNVKLVPDLAPYRQLKVRLLNAVHTAMVPVAYLCGIDDVRSATEHKLVAKFLDILINNEILPTVEVSKSEAEDFAKEVMARFANPYVKHLLMSIALNSTAKFVARNLPIIKDYQAKFAQVPNQLSFALASLIIFYRGIRNNETISLNDNPSILEFFATTWSDKELSTKDIVYKILSNDKIWQESLAHNTELLSSVTNHVTQILNNGMLKALEEII